jgi:signal transduction histidine kinase
MSTTLATRANAGPVARIVPIAGVFVAYLATARLGLLMDAVNGFATLVWPPTGIALFALLRFGYRTCPAVFAGALAANLWSGATPSAALGIALGNTLEAVAGAWLLGRMRFDDTFARVRDVVAFVAAATTSTVISASIGVASLRIGGMLKPGSGASTWLAWWLGDMCGDLVIAPVLFVWTRAPRPFERAGTRREAALLGAAMTFSLLVLGLDWFPGLRQAPLTRTYFLFPVLTWAAVRFAQPGATATAFLVSVVAIAATALGRGPFVGPTLSAGLLTLQGFMAVSTVTMLVLAAAVSERDRAFREAQAAIRARDNFLSVASHELRTPLTSLDLQVASLERAASAGKAPEPAWFAGKIAIVAKQVDRLARLTDRLLDVTRLASGRVELDLATVDFALVVNEVLAQFREALAAAGCEITADVAEPCIGRWDRFWLDQIVTNLVSNAAKYGAGKPIGVVLRAEGDAAVLRVRDRGIGIAPSDQARLFRRFERIASPQRFAGLGLGLWIVRQVVEAMNGTVAVASEPGHGAEFTVTLPKGIPDA